MEERGTLYIFDLEFVLLQNSSVFLLLRFVMGSEFKETFKKKNPLNKFIDVVLIIFGRQFLTAPLFKGVNCFIICFIILFLHGHDDNEIVTLVMRSIRIRSLATLVRHLDFEGRER
ncbi:unnamed protein product [Lathyrus sativus]|nr:unnamed protein product [Lathyrus sativus]